VRPPPSFPTQTDRSEDACPARCRCPAPPRCLNDCRLGPGDLNGGGPTISAAHLSQSRSAAGLSRCCTAGLSRCCAAGLSLPGIWRARSSPAASARGGPAPTWRRHGLAARVLELGQTRLGLGVRPLRRSPVPARELDSWSLEPTTRRLGLGTWALALISALADGLVASRLAELRPAAALIGAVPEQPFVLAGAGEGCQHLSAHCRRSNLRGVIP
jgi:hypothetical protein